MWLDAATNPAAPQYAFEAGEFLEVVTKDPTSLVVTGTWIFEVVKAHAGDGVGRFIEVKSCGSSVPLLAAQLGQAFPDSGGGYGVVHLCAGPIAGCMGTAPGRYAFHADCFRRRKVGSINEPWFKAPSQAVSAGKAKADKVAELKEKLLAERIRSGAASAEEAVAYNLALSLKRKAARKDKKKKHGSDDDDEPTKKKQKKESSEDEDNSSLFGGPLSLHGLGNPILKGASENPGNLYRQAALAASSQTGARGRGAEVAAAYASTGEQWLQYVRTVLAPQYPGGIPAELMRELETLAASLQHLARGEVSQLGDLLVQRFKSLELGLAGNEAAASVVQLVSAHQSGLTNHQEIALAQRWQKDQFKLAEQQRTLR